MKGQQQQRCMCINLAHSHIPKNLYVYRHPQKVFLTQKIRVRTFFQSSKTMRKHTTTVQHHLGPKMTKNLRSGGDDGGGGGVSITYMSSRDLNFDKVR